MKNESRMEITQKGNVTVTKFMTSNITDMEAINLDRERLKKYIAENQPARVVFDFDKVDFFSSQLLGLILDIRARLQSLSGEVVISSISPQLHRLFKITHLDRVFRFYPDSMSAVKNANSGTD